MTNEVRTTSATGGQKGVKDERFDLIPIDALTQLARHYGVGARKYDDNQWRKGYEWSKSYAALLRHLTQWWGGEDADEETGSSHLVAVAWHAFTLLTFVKDHPQFDDRFRAEKGSELDRQLEDLLRDLPSVPLPQPAPIEDTPYDDELAYWEKVVSVIFNGFVGSANEEIERVGTPVYIDPITGQYTYYNAGSN